ncbi:hypothetical protein H6764_03500 [Candidatus Nomurabacteria bacterium]|nr:hypothetical protein [Candidatus Nomurabacteria bacterium]
MLKKIAKYGASFAAVSQAFVVAAYAQTASSLIGSGAFSNQATAGGGTLLGFIRTTLNFGIGIAGLIAVGFLVFSGIQYITAGGDDSKVQKATAGITYSVVGLIICFVSVLIVNFVLTEILATA